MIEFLANNPVVATSLIAPVWVAGMCVLAGLLLLAEWLCSRGE